MPTEECGSRQFGVSRRAFVFFNAKERKKQAQRAGLDLD
jgi:hypothetical protein